MGSPTGCAFYSWLPLPHNLPGNKLVSKNFRLMIYEDEISLFPAPNAELITAFLSTLMQAECTTIHVPVGNDLNYLPFFQLYLSITCKALQIALRQIITFAFHNNPHLFNKHLSTYYVPGTILSVGNIAVKKQINPQPYGAYNSGLKKKVVQYI